MISFKTAGPRGFIWTTRGEIWAWLKAERQWQDKVRQWLNREQYSDLDWPDRVMGRPKPAQQLNRAAKREYIRRNVKHIVRTAR